MALLKLLLDFSEVHQIATEDEVKLLFHNLQKEGINEPQQLAFICDASGTVAPNTV